MFKIDPLRCSSPCEELRDTDGQIQVNWGPLVLEVIPTGPQPKAQFFLILQLVFFVYGQRPKELVEVTSII